MNRQTAERYTLATAGAVIIALTAGAFWLSYAHLAEVAGQHGLGHSPARQWAWPASLDTAIIAGELLMLRAGLRKEVDWWAIALTAAGSIGSIALNIAGVSSTGGTGTVPVLDYVVAAVPPTAALVAFGVLMRQIHQLVTEPAGHGSAPAADSPSPSVLPTVTATRDTSDHRTKTTEGPEHDTGPEVRSEGADQTGDTPADRPQTTDADQPPATADHKPVLCLPRTSAADQDQKAPDRPTTGPDHARTTAADQTEAADQMVGDHDSGTLRTSITAGQTPDQAADHQRTTQPTAPGPAVGDNADQPVAGPSNRRTAADRLPDQTGKPPADQLATGPARQRTTSPDRPTPALDHLRSTDAHQVGNEPVPMERLVELARTAALTEGRMTRRVIRPYLRAQSIQISNERFAGLQTRLYQDPALAHLPRSQRKTR
ncbi:DUF2637 domain-containing protein [Streptomyces sp. NPDC004726]